MESRQTKRDIVDLILHLSWRGGGELFNSPFSAKERDCGLYLCRQNCLYFYICLLSRQRVMLHFGWKSEMCSCEFSNQDQHFDNSKQTVPWPSFAYGILAIVSIAPVRLFFFPTLRKAELFMQKQKYLHLWTIAQQRCILDSCLRGSWNMEEYCQPARGLEIVTCNCQ